LAADLQRQFGVNPQLVEGKGGIFDVHADGKLIFSKHTVGRFPEDGEVSVLIRSMDRTTK
jgi:predicted Rdx family selenoprotein